MKEEETTPDLTLKLPNEIWIKISSYLYIDDLCELCLVNWRFYHIAFDPILWSSISIKSDAISSTETVIKLLKRAPLLTELKLHCRDDISSLLAAVSQFSTRLKDLEVRFCPTLKFSDLEQVTSGCSQLVNLDLECTGCSNKDGEKHDLEGSSPCTCLPSNSFGMALSSLKHLNSLNLFACKNLNSVGLQVIADGCPSLEIINIDEVNYLSDDSFIYFISKTKDRLLQFVIDGESLTDKSFSAFGDLRKLQLLSISFADNMGSEGLLAISKLSNLEYLQIRRGYDLRPLDFVRTFDNKRLEKLLFLNLSECSKLSDLSLMTIAMNCPKLATLTLAWCWELTDVSLKSVVKHCNLLINLNLCGVVKLLGEFIGDIPRSLHFLKSLDLEQCPDIELDALRDLLRKNLKLEIKEYYGELVDIDEGIQELLYYNPNIEFVSFDGESDSD